MIDSARNSAPGSAQPAWAISAGTWLTPRRIRAQAIVLAVCLWGVCAVDFATPGLVDRAGNIKFQDFLPLYIAARLVAENRAAQLYDQRVAADEMQAIIGQPVRVRLPFVYGPQVGLLFAPIARLSFPAAARLWASLSLLAYFVCIYLFWKCCPTLHSRLGIVAISAIAFPPLFHFFVRAQISVLVLACFTCAYVAFRCQHDWVAGIMLGLLVFKPQFLVAIPLVLLMAHAWKAFVGLAVSSAAQLTLTWIYFGSPVMQAYFDTLLHPSRWLGTTELSLAAIQMHSLRSFWSLVIPWPQAAFVLYTLCSLVALWWAASVWRFSSPLALRFSALTLVAVLVNPHLFAYDLVVLAPVLLLLIDWTLRAAQDSSSPVLRLLLYLAFVLPLFGPLSRWTHLQLSVSVFAGLLWVLWRDSKTTGHKVALSESHVV